MKKALNVLIISALTIAIGFISMALPFHLIDNLTQFQMRVLLAGEIAVYICIFSAYFGGKEAKAQRRIRESRMKEQHEERIARRNEELKGITINNYDLAA